MSDYRKEPYYVIAPLTNSTAAIVAYNLYVDDIVLKGTITSDDYKEASGSIQPYPGKWNLPKEGIVVYDYFEGKGEKLMENYNFEINGLNDKYVILSTIVKGWAVIGRTDKYLTAAAVENIKQEENKISFSLNESGPFAIWLAKGNPFSEGLKFIDKGNGLWSAEMEVGKKNVNITIYKKYIN